MSVIIKGMEMPKSCLGCDFATTDDDMELYCPFTGIVCLNIGRQDECPIVEVPPHGRLIDKEALESDISHSVVFTAKSGTDPEIRGANKIIQRINIAPTVIEAEEEPCTKV